MRPPTSTTVTVRTSSSEHYMYLHLQYHGSIGPHKTAPDSCRKLRCMAMTHITDIMQHPPYCCWIAL